MPKKKSTKDTCGSKVWASCVFYEGSVPESSDLSEETCLVVEETIEDMYSLIDSILEGTDLSDFAQDSCIEYEASGDELSVVDILNKHNEELCSLKEQLEESSEDDDNTGNNSGGANSATLDSLGLDLDLKCLELDCEEITNLNQLFQALVDKVCSLQETLDNGGPIKSTML